MHRVRSAGQRAPRHAHRWAPLCPAHVSCAGTAPARCTGGGKGLRGPPQLTGRPRAAGRRGWCPAPAGSCPRTRRPAGSSQCSACPRSPGRAAGSPARSGRTRARPLPPAGQGKQGQVGSLVQGPPPPAQPPPEPGRHPTPTFPARNRLVPMPRLKEVARGSVQMLCVGRCSASEAQNLEEQASVRTEPPPRLLPWHGTGHCPSQGRAGPAWSQHAAALSQQPPPAALPAWGAPRATSLPQPPPRQAALTCSRSAGSFPPPGARRPSRERRWRRRGRAGGPGAGTAERSGERSPCQLPCPHIPRSHWPRGGGGQHHGDVLWLSLCRGCGTGIPWLPLRARPAARLLRVPPLLTAVSPGWQPGTAQPGTAQHSHRSSEPRANRGPRVLLLPGPAHPPCQCQSHPRPHPRGRRRRCRRRRRCGGARPAGACTPGAPPSSCSW